MFERNCSKEWDMALHSSVFQARQDISKSRRATKCSNSGYSIVLKAVVCLSLMMYFHLSISTAVPLGSLSGVMTKFMKLSFSSRPIFYAVKSSLYTKTS